MSETEKTRLQQQIRDIEAVTDAEIVTVIARASDSYTYIPALWAALLALCLPGVYFLLLELRFDGWSDTELTPSMTYVYAAQVILFLALLLLFQWQPLQMRMIPAAVKRQRAHRHAQLQFVQQGVHANAKRSGVLLFVSVAEHYVEIIADQAVAATVDNTVWTGVIERFVTQVRQGQVASGFSAAIDDCGKVLQQHFPGSRDAADDLPNHLIEV